MIARTLLENYHLLTHSTNPAMRDILLDLHQAFRDAALNEEERQVIVATYIGDYGPPQRKGGRGRPKGGDTQMAIVAQLIDALSREPRRNIHNYKKKDTEYNVIQRGTYWYKKVLNRALLKIDNALNYEELDDLPTQTLRYMQQGYGNQIAAMQ